MAATDKTSKRKGILNPLTIVGGLVALVFVGWLAFGFFGVQTLFTNEVVDEAGPVFGSTAAEPDANASATTGAEAADDEMADSEMAESESSEGETESVAASTPATEDEPATTTTAPQIVTLVSGDFIDRDHPTSGVASVLTDGSSQRFLRFEDFETDNGPDLNVYLSTAEPGASNGDLGADFIDLGDLKGNQGSQNYEIPEDVDLSKYKTVAIWCVRFGVPFGTAPLA